MAYQALVLPVMIASPGDVNTERAIIREVLHEWNDINSHAKKIILQPVGWETHSSPELGQPAQVLINERILKDCDLLVAVFWTRVGTPTLNEKSGTIVEIKEHIEAGKPAMVYFSSAPVAPAMLDDKQYKEVTSFMEWCKPRGLIETYENKEQFSNAFRRHIQLTLQKSDYIDKLISDFLSLSSNVTANAQIHEEPSIISLLSKSAIELLLLAAKDVTGEIIKMPVMGGLLLQTNSVNLAAGANDPRERARLEDALDQLVEYGLVVPKGAKNQFFSVTTLGYQIADEIKELDK